MKIALKKKGKIMQVQKNNKKTLKQKGDIFQLAIVNICKLACNLIVTLSARLIQLYIL